jgi:iron complex transport system substrate-binding protein
MYLMRINFRRGLVLLLLLAALPSSGAASGGTDAEEFTLGIFGNANMDSTIDDSDISYVQGTISGTNTRTDLSDANHDGKVDQMDIEQIKKIIKGEETELIFTDAVGSVVTVQMPVERVAILSSMAAEAIKVLKADKLVVGIDKSTAKDQIFYPDLCKLPQIGTSSEPDIESIISLHPNIVLCTGSIGAARSKLEDELKGTGATVVRMDFYKDENMLNEIETLGYLINKRAEANDFVDFYGGYQRLILDKTKELSKNDKPKVYMESHDSYVAHSTGTGFNTRCAIAGGRNIVAEANLTGGTAGSYPVVDPEWVMEQNPDIIIKNPSSKVVAGYSTDNTSEVKAIWDEVRERPELANVSAVRNEKIYVISAISGGPKIIIGTVYMAKWFHPDLFKELDPQDVHQEYLTRFLGLDYDLKKNGVFVYPANEW